MAEIILKDKLKLAGVKGIRVSSAGLCANEGSKISENSKKALKLFGLTSYSFRAKQLTPEMIKKANVVICMTNEHKRMLSAFKNVYTLGELTGGGDVEDPYGGNLTQYIKVSHAISDACGVLLSEILESKGE